MSKYTREQVDAAVKAQESSAEVLNFDGDSVKDMADLMLSVAKLFRRCHDLGLTTPGAIDDAALSMFKKVPK